WLMMSLWDALRMNMMISYQELVRTFPRLCIKSKCTISSAFSRNLGASLKVGMRGAFKKMIILMHNKNI
ncbi:hypothetical protein, partial [Escherichia coli]|uniref:hypothetical protein n=1 Tax=Escherichia coli TaxID=562 RepID=UPI001BC937C5